MQQEVKLPSLGEDGVQKVEVSEWFVAVGGHVQPGDDLLEITTDKAAFCVPSPIAGEMVEHKVAPGDVISVGDVVCIMDL